LTSARNKLWKNETFQTVLTIVLIVLVVFGFWYGSQAVLNTRNPLLVVVSGSMDTISDGQTEGYTHPFARTLQRGDLIIIQGVNPAILRANYPNSDIIVFHEPTDPSTLIVHRIVAVEVINGTYYFRTKGDGNPVHRWPNPIAPDEYDAWGWVPQNEIVGKVITRIPLVGYIDIETRKTNLIIPLIVLAIIILIVVEFILPLLRGKKTPPNESKDLEPEKVSGNSQHPVHFHFT
jgi:signal peptidase I